MCVVSMVHDHYWPVFEPYTGRQQTITIPPFPTVSNDLEKIIKAIEDFKRAIEAAKTVDSLTQQPDCVDPEKAKLLERVEWLEKEIERITGRKFCP